MSEESKITYIKLKKNCRTFGWVQDGGRINNLKKVVSVFDYRTSEHQSLLNDKIPNLVANDEVRIRLIDALNKRPLLISYKDLVGTHRDPRSTSPCDSIIQATIKGQRRGYITDWAADSYVRWAHCLGLIDYIYDQDCFTITNLGLEYVNSKTIQEETEIIEIALLSYPPVCRILELLSEGEHRTKFELGSKLGFVGEAGFTSLPQNILIMNLAVAESSKEKSKMKTDWDGTSDKYARMICSWLMEMKWVKKIPKKVKTVVGDKQYEEIIPQSYVITPSGLKAYRRVRGVNIAKKVPKRVCWEMFATKGKDKNYIRIRRAYVLKELIESNKPLSVDQIVERLKSVKLDEKPSTIKDDLEGFVNLGINISITNKGYVLSDNIIKFQIPILEISNTKKSDIYIIKENLAEDLVNLSHNYLDLIEIAYDSDQNRLFEMKVVDLFVTECGFEGIHLGGGRRPDGVIYTTDLKNNYGVIIDTKAYSKGYSLPIKQSDAMRRYVNENNARNDQLNEVKWWEEFPERIEEFTFLFVSSHFTGQFLKRIINIVLDTKTHGAAVNVVELLRLAEMIKGKKITLEQFYNCLIIDDEITAKIFS